MTRRRALTRLAVLTLIVSSAAGCGDSGGSNPATPGGGGPSFNFTFPATGTSNRFDFATAGTWDYHCTPHQGSGMTGTVVVNASATDDSAVVNVGPGNALVFSPASVTIKPGGYVRWVNQSNMTNHTVTRP